MKKVLIIPLILLAISWADPILVFSPDENGTILKNEVLIAASFFELGGVDPASVFLYLDGVDITDRATIEADMLSYAPSRLEPGPHQARILIKRDYGTPIEKRWRFEVAGKKSWTEQLQWNGKLTSGYRLDKVDDNQLGVSTVGMNFRGTAYNWVQVRTNIKIASDENPLLQPRNRYSFGLSFKKFLDLNFGDINSIITRFTLDGKRVRGYEANLRLNIINFQFISGELMRGIDGSSEADESYKITRFALEDSVAQFKLNRIGYTFRQNITGGRLSFGAGENFALGFSLLKVKDDVNSVSSIMSDARISLDRDSLGLAAGTYTLAELQALNSDQFNVSLAEPTNWNGPTPQDNLVISSDIGFYLDHKRALLEGEVAFSLYNKDIWDGAITKAQMDTLMGDSADGLFMGSVDLDMIPFDPRDIEDYFVIGIGMLPLLPIDPEAFSDSGSVSLFDAILHMPSLAYQTRAKLQYFGHYFTIEYSRIGPQFRSLANPYLLTGTNNFKISDRVQLLKNRVMLGVTYKHQDDDVLTKATRKVTTQNTFTTNLTLIPGPGWPTLMFSYRLLGRNNGIKTIDQIQNPLDDSFIYDDNRENTRTDNLTTSINYNFDALGWKNNVFGTYVFFNKRDLFSDRDLDSTFIDPALTSNVFNVVVNTQYDIPLKTAISFTTNASAFNIGPGIKTDQRFTIGKLDAEYGFFDQLLIVIGGVNYMNGSGMQAISRVGVRTGVKIRLIEDLVAQATFDLRQKTANDVQSVEIKGLAGLSYVF